MNEKTDDAIIQSKQEPFIRRGMTHWPIFVSNASDLLETPRTRIFNFRVNAASGLPNVGLCVISVGRIEREALVSTI